MTHEYAACGDVTTRPRARWRHPRRERYQQDVTAPTETTPKMLLVQEAVSVMEEMDGLTVHEQVRRSRPHDAHGQTLQSQYAVACAHRAMTTHHSSRDYNSKDTTSEIYSVKHGGNGRFDIVYAITKEADERTTPPRCTSNGHAGRRRPLIEINRQNKHPSFPTTPKTLQTYHTA